MTVQSWGWYGRIVSSTRSPNSGTSATSTDYVTSLKVKWVYTSIIECVVVTCRFLVANTLPQRATKLLLLSLSHFTLLSQLPLKLDGLPGGELVHCEVLNVGQNKWCARWRNERRRQEDYIGRFISNGWRFGSNTIEGWLVSLNQQRPATAAEEVMASVLRFC